MPITIAKAGLLAGLISVSAVQAADDTVYGFRVGATLDDDDFVQYELYVLQPLPWRWQLGTDWRLLSELNASIGGLSAEGDRGALLTLGPALALSRTGATWTVRGGISPTLLSDDVFGNKDLGGDFHFTSHIGIDWRFAGGWTLGYRYSHMSNGDFEDPNPGLDVHALQVSGTF